MSRIDDLFAFLSIPSVSAQAEHAADVERCADFLVNKLTSIGFSAKKYLTDIHPIVVAHSPKVEGAPTVLIYGHYDVMPVDPISEWKSDPFKPEIRDGRVYARGASDDKGEIMAMILAAQEVIAEDGALPLNVIYLLEGEEERGSASLYEFMKRPDAKELLACDVIIVSDTGMAAVDIPSFSYGLKGLCCFELEVSAPAMDLHSGIFGGAVANPITTLCEMIASTHDADNHVSIDGFYDGVMEIQDFPRSQKNKAHVQEAQLPDGVSTQQKYEAPAKTHPGLTCLLVSASAPHAPEVEGTDPFLFIEERSWVSASVSERLN